MRKVLLLIAAIATFAAASAAYAGCPSYGGYGYSGFGRYGGGYGRYGGGYGYRPGYGYGYTRTVKCVIHEVRDDGTLRVEDEADGQEHEIRLDDSVNVTTRYKKAFDGRGRLAADDLEEGQRIAVTSFSRRRARQDGEIVKVRVLRPRDAPGRGLPAAP